MKLIVLSLPRETTKEELVEIFEPYGQVEACNIVMNSGGTTSKGFGFVEMQDEHAKAAMTALHGSKIGKRKIRVKESSD